MEGQSGSSMTFDTPGTEFQERHMLCWQGWPPPLSQQPYVAFLPHQRIWKEGSRDGMDKPSFLKAREAVKFPMAESDRFGESSLFLLDVIR